MNIVIKIGDDTGKVRIQVEGEHTQDSRAKRICDVILPPLRAHFKETNLKRIRSGMEVGL
jgi:hypothetical protein